jgi:hypothetical protein
LAKNGCPFPALPLFNHLILVSPADIRAQAWQTGANKLPRRFGMITGSCHCGAVSWTFDGVPEKLTNCNCTLCRRIGGLWAYGDVDTVKVIAAADATIAYVQGDKSLATHSCRTCGCTTHWQGLVPDDGVWRMAVNMRMADPAAYAGIRVRHFDGADTWTFLD